MQNKPLILSLRYWPIFWTQFWGAMNDNILKNAIVILIAFKSYSILGLNESLMVALCGAIFIFPFFIFSALAGQYSDKISKSKLVIFTKILELLVVILGAFGFFYESIHLLFSSLFLTGLQSTIFGPAKYSILPELIEVKDLVKGNALVEMGTFLSILIGTIIGGVLAGKENGAILISGTIITVSILGLLCSLMLPKLKPVSPELKIDFNLFRSTSDILKICKKTKSVYISVLGISWFWYFGATLLSIFPIYVKDILHANENVVTLFLAIFSIGVAIGSVICEKCSHERVELGLVPFGSIGLSLFVFVLFLIGTPYEATGELLGVYEFLAQPNTYQILFALSGLSIMSGFFIVPLYTFIQVRSDRETRSRVIAANNILNALFMVVAALVLMGLFAFGFTAIDIFLVLFVLNTLVSIYIYTVIPEFLMRFVCVIMGTIVYRLKVSGQENIPTEGPAVLICNHVSFIDWMIISACVKRPIRFVMHYSFMKNPVFAFFFKGAKVIPIAGQKEDPVLMEKAFDIVASELSEGHLICIFPEGQITRDGKLSSFRPGIERIIKRSPVPVVPMILNGLWGSFFSRKYGSAASKYSVIPKRIWSRVELLIQSPWTPETVSATELEGHFKSIMGEDQVQ